MMTRSFLTLLVFAGYALLVGCGTTGPLYIPEQRYPQEAQDIAPEQSDASATEQPSN